MKIPFPLIFVATLPASGPLLIDDLATHHLRVRRQLVPGQGVVLSDGASYTQAVLDLEKKKCWARYQEVLPCPERPSRLHLHLSVIKPEPLAWAIQKATEMGVASIQLLKAKRSQQSYWSEKSYEHLKKVMLSACEQSGQYRPPQLLAPCDLMGLDFSTDKKWLYAQLPKDHEDYHPPIITAGAQLCYLIGPEGGWDQEEEVFLASKAEKLSLPGPVLRAETAALACTAVLLWGSL